MTFNLDDLDALINYLEEYKKGLDEKARLISERLADLGITIAQQYANGGLSKYVTFSKEVDGDEILFCASSDLLTVTWDTKDGVKTADISPVLMCEFGSGRYADNPFDNLQGIGGTGTFPGQTHADDPNGWWYHNDTGWHHSYGLTPSQPMYHAYIGMLEDIVKVAREVFGYVG